jgi:hypothetical protein
MLVLEMILKVVSIMSNLLVILEKVHNYFAGIKKDPSGLATGDGSEDESSIENS